MNSFFFSFKEWFMLLQQLFIPKEIHERVEEIDIEGLFKKGFNTVILDVDNTLLTYHENKLSLQKTNWLDHLKMIGFRTYLVTNNINKRRLIKINKQVNAQGLYFALKPFPFSIQNFADDEIIDLKRSLIIGDQLFKDVVMGNWVRAYTILVDPMDKKLSFFKTLQREVELFVLKKLRTTH